MNDKLYIFDQDNVRINVYEELHTDVHSINDAPSVEIVKIYEQGPQGPKGDDGTAYIPDLVVTSSQQINFYLIQNAPFYPIISGSLFGTTSSFAFFGVFSSSLLPWSSSFDLGSSANPWKSVFASDSIFIVNSKITTSSYGFEEPVIQRISHNQQIFNIRSGSVSASFTQDGVLSIPDFQVVPSVVRGGLFLSGSDFFVGI